MDDEYCGLPTDFDINENIPTLNQQLKKVPLSMYFYHLLMRMELDKAKRDGRTWIWLVVVKMMSFISCVCMCLCVVICVVICVTVAVTMIMCWFTTHFWSGKSRRSGVVKLLEKFKKRIYKNQLRQVRRLSGLFGRMIFVGSSYNDILFSNFSSLVSSKKEYKN